MTFGYVSSSTSFVSQNTVYNPAYVVADANGDGINDITNFYLTSGGTKLGHVYPSGELRHKRNASGHVGE